MNEIFQRCGEEEFRFIERSGFYFGFLLGVAQVMASPSISFHLPRSPSISL